MIKGVIYDLDDLMVNSDPLHNVAWGKILAEYGHEWEDIPEATRNSMIGQRVIDDCKMIIDVLKLDTDLESFYKRRTELFLEIIEKQLDPMPGLFSSLELFKKNKLKIAIGSSGARRYIEIVLNKFKIAHFFDAIVTGDDVTKGKPDPQVYLIASKKLGLKPEECLVLEDATKGIAAAKAAGCKCIGVRNPFTLPQDQSQADLVLNSLDEITVEMIKSI